MMENKLNALNKVLENTQYEIETTFGGEGLSVFSRYNFSKLVTVGFDDRANKFSINTVGTRMDYERIAEYEKDFYETLMLIGRLNNVLDEFDK